MLTNDQQSPSRSFDPVGAGPYLKYTRNLLCGVMLMVMVILPVLLYRALQLEDFMATTRLEVAENETWVIAQLEVDYLKFALAVETARSSADDLGTVALQDIPDVLKQFDILYSRISTAATKLRIWSDTSDVWDECLDKLDIIILHRDQLAEIIDSFAASESEIGMTTLDGAIASIGSEVRELSLSTLQLLSAQKAENRLSYVYRYRALLLQSAVMVVVMLLISMATLLALRQISNKAAAERRLTENLNRVFEARPHAIILTDANLRILRMNTAAALLLGVHETQMRDVKFLDKFFPGIQRLARLGRSHPLNDNTRSENDLVYRDILRRVGGCTRAVEVARIRLVTDGDGDNQALFIRDISETQHALRALRRERGSARSEAKRYKRFLAVMSHEIRTPLHAIIAALDLAALRPKSPELADLHATALEAAQVALQQADAVLEIGRAEYQMTGAEPTQFSPADIVYSLVQMAAPIANSQGTKISVEIAQEAEASVFGLRPCFWHAVSNLLSNAVKFTQNGKVRVSLERNEEWLKVEVADQGPGIAAELQTVIFRDHYSAGAIGIGRGKGAGLGLGVFVAAVEAMSGQYGLKSAIGEGSTFWFTLPATSAGRALPTALKKPAQSQPFMPPNMQVLVVDDSDVNLELMQQMLSVLGLRPDVASSGVDAVARAFVCAYDLILLDLSMPDMDGYAVAAAIRKSGSSRHAIIIALTANVLAREEIGKPDSDFDDLWLKPLRLDDLRQALVTCVGSARAVSCILVPFVDQPAAQDLLRVLPATKVRQFLAAVFDEAEKLARDLKRGADKEDLANSFHRVAGSAGMLAMGRLQELALQGEAACKELEQALGPVFLAKWTQAVSDTSNDWSKLLASSDNAA